MARRCQAAEGRSQRHCVKHFTNCQAPIAVRSLAASAFRRALSRASSERPPGAASHASGPAEADRHLPVFDDDWHGAAAEAVLEHPLEIGWILLDVDVLERSVPPLIIVTGGLRVGSSVLAEDVNHESIFRVSLDERAKSGWRGM